MERRFGYLLFLVFTLMMVLSTAPQVRKVAAPFGTIYIRADGSIDPPTANITTSDNITYTFTADISASLVIEKNDTVIDGAGYTLQGPGSGTGVDLVYRNNVTLQNIEVTSFFFGILINSSSNSLLAGNTASNSDSGILLCCSSNNILSGNTVSNNGDGIYLRESSNNNTVTGNTATANNNGIYLYWLSSNNTVSGNTATANQWGIVLDRSSDNNTVTGNTASTSHAGIGLLSSRDNTIASNYASSNSDSGIYIDNSTNNIVTGNTASTNQWGIYLVASGNNVFFHNNLIDNANNVEVSSSDVNAWDDGVEGNYWSNYTGVDLNQDGIGDLPHVITSNNTDNYPLMGMFHTFNTSLGNSVNVISNSTVDSFQYESPGTIRFHVSNMTANQTHGFCRVSIPYAVLPEPFNVTIDGANPTFWNYTLHDNGTHHWIYFEYAHSTLEVVIIPESPVLMLPLVMIISLLATLVYRRRRA